MGIELSTSSVIDSSTTLLANQSKGILDRIPRTYASSRSLPNSAGFHPGARIVKLEENYRSTSSVVTAAV